MLEGQRCPDEDPALPQPPISALFSMVCLCICDVDMMMISFSMRFRFLKVKSLGACWISLFKTETPHLHQLGEHNSTYWTATRRSISTS